MSNRYMDQIDDEEALIDGGEHLAPPKSRFQQFKDWIRPHMTRGNIIKAVIFLTILGLVFATFVVLTQQGYITLMLEAIRDLGAWGMVIMGVIMAIACFPFVPGYVPFLLACGFLYSWLGAVPAIIGSNVGAALVLVICRQCARPLMERKMKDSPQLEGIDEALSINAIKFVILVRITPIPWSWSNLLFAASRVKLWQFCVGTFLGGLVEQALLIYAGTTIGSLTDLSSTQWTPGYIALFVLQIVAIVVVTVVIVFIGRREYNKIMAVVAARREAALQLQQQEEEDGPRQPSIEMSDQI